MTCFGSFRMTLSYLDDQEAVYVWVLLPVTDHLGQFRQGSSVHPQILRLGDLPAVVQQGRYVVRTLTGLSAG